MTSRFLTALPVFNERNHLRPVLSEVRRFAQDILVVDDGSTDGTGVLLDSLADDQLAVVHHSRNQGYGAALRTAFDYACAHGYDAIVTIDCDGQHEPSLIPRLVRALYPPDGRRVDIVSGSRYLEVLPGQSAPPADRRAINIRVTELVNQLLGLDLTDTFCGFKAYRVDALQHFDITDTGYAMPLQLWVQAARAGLRIQEFSVPLIYLDEKRSFGGSLDDARIREAHYREVITQELARGPAAHTDCLSPRRCTG